MLLRQTLVRTVNNVYMTAVHWLKSQKRQRISLESTNTSYRGTYVQIQLCPALETLEKQCPVEGLTEVIIALGLHGTEVAQRQHRTELSSSVARPGIATRM